VGTDDTGLLPEGLRSRVAAVRQQLRRNVPAANCLSAAFDAAEQGDLARAEILIAEAEVLIEANPPATGTGNQARSSANARTIIWKGLIGILAPPTARPGPVLVMTDGSAGRHDHSGWAFLVDDGHWGCQGGEYTGSWQDPRGGVNGNSSALVAELRAVNLALTVVTGQVVVLADSLAALTLLHAWQRGDTTRMPAGYSLRDRGGRSGWGARPPTLVKLAETVAGRAGELTFKHVKGRSGVALNEGADALANLARRWMRGTQSPGEAAMRAAADAAVRPYLFAAWGYNGRRRLAVGG
jgi:ribonuclease HI